jgi:hypothetical protein
MKMEIYFGMLTSMLVLQIADAQSTPPGNGRLQDTYESAMQPDNWALSNEFGVPMWMALNAPPAAGRAYLRKMYLYVDANDFSEDNIRKAITGLASKYNDPTHLVITVFSDRSMLLRAISLSQGGIAIEFSDAPENQEDVRKFQERFYPHKSGYYRAHYSRTVRGDESLLYSPDPDKEELVRVQLNRSK